MQQSNVILTFEINYLHQTKNMFYFAQEVNFAKDEGLFFLPLSLTL